jgi:hypothetical protein
MKTPPTILPVLERLKESYKIWHAYHEKLPKTQKYSIGNKIDNLFVEIIEMTCSAIFLPKTEKLPYVKVAIRKLDTIKIMLMILWEFGILEDKKYITLSFPLNESGKMLGGWHGQLSKQNSPEKTGEK